MKSALARAKTKQHKLMAHMFSVERTNLIYKVMKNFEGKITYL